MTAAGTPGPPSLASGNSTPNPLRAVGRHSHPPFLSPLSSLAREVCKVQGVCPGTAATWVAQLCVLNVAVEVGGLVRKPPGPERGALAPGRGGGSCPLVLVLPRVPVRAWADDTTWTRLP